MTAAMEERTAMDTRTMVVQVIGMLLLAVVVCSPVACTMNRHRLVAEAIKGGADPLAAKCAIETTNTTDSLCLAKALGK
jgi:hypothetical protein